MRHASAVLRSVLLWLSLAIVANAPPAVAAERIGVVLMHGNFSWGGQFKDMAPVIRDAGFGLETPDMCWSDRRTYDRTAEECMDEVEEAFDRLRDAGFDWMVVAGHSMGGINALLYAAHHRDLAGVIVFAPSKAPRANSYDVQEAQRLVERGRGDIRLSVARGYNFYETPARAFLSFRGPDSPLYDSKLLPQLSAPLLWVADTMDNGPPDAADRFALAPSTPLNQLVIVEADHFSTPDVAVGDMIAWLKELSAAPND